MAYDPFLWIFECIFLTIYVSVLKCELVRAHYMCIPGILWYISSIFLNGIIYDWKTEDYISETP